MTSPFIPFHVAAEQIPGLATGQILRYGAILKDAGTGRIIGHLQETGLFGQSLSIGTNLLGNAANPINAFSSIFSIVQNEQIKSRLANIESLLGGMQALQLATLATSVVGIGVTVASTAILLDRIKQLDSAVQRMESKIDNLPAQWRDMKVSDRLLDLGSHLSRINDGMLRSDSEQVVRNAEEKLDYDFDRFTNDAKTISGERTIDASLLGTLLAAISICAGAQFKALLYLNEKEAALKNAVDQNRRIEELTWYIPQDVLENRLGDNKDQAESIALDASRLRIRLASRPLLLQTLIKQDIHGRDYIEQAEQETEEPLLVLPVQRAA